MRIAFVTTQSDSMGGSHVHVRDVSSALKREGHEVCVFVGGDGPYTRQLEELGVPVRSLQNMVRAIRPAKDYKAVGELQAALREFRPDMISSHSSKAGIIARIAGHRLGVPTLFTAHGWSFTDGVPELQRRIYEVSERFVAKYSKRIICVAEADRQLALRRRVGDERTLVTVHNGMPDSPERADAAKNPPSIVSVARLDEQKDHPTLFRALASLMELPWQLELVGDGSRRGELESLAKELGISDRVLFHGTQKNVKPFLAGAQVFALVSNWEGFPRSTVEAMRTGLPAIVSDVGGSREAIVEGQTGYSVPASNVAALAEKLRIVLGDADLRRKMGVNARMRYEEYFTFEAMFAKTKAVYADVIGRPIDAPNLEREAAPASH